MAKRKISLSLNFGLYLAQDQQETALVEPLGSSSTYVWITCYQTPGFMPQVIYRGPRGAEKKGSQSKPQDWSVRRKHHGD